MRRCPRCGGYVLRDDEGQLVCLMCARPLQPPVVPSREVKREPNHDRAKVEVVT